MNRYLRSIFAALLTVAFLAPSASAAPETAETAETPTTDGDSYRTDVLFLDAMTPARAIALYERLIGRDGEAQIFEGRNPLTVIVYDTADRLDRFRALLSALDTEKHAGLRLFVRPVRYMEPSELAQVIVLLEDGGRLAASLTMVPDDRTSTLIVSTSAERYIKLDKLIRRLDVPSDDPRRKVRVIPGQDR